MLKYQDIGTKHASKSLETMGVRKKIHLGVQGHKHILMHNHRILLQNLYLIGLVTDFEGSIRGL